MTGSRLTVSPEADADLAAIAEYISEHDGPKRADAAVQRIQRTMSSLAARPGMGRARSYLEDGMRAFSTPPWIVCYALKADGSGIDVLHIIDSRRDLAALFGRRNPPDKE